VLKFNDLKKLIVVLDTQSIADICGICHKFSLILKAKIVKKRNV
jgi:hypothetical protein